MAEIRPVRKTITLGITLISLLLTVMAGLAWVNNLYIAKEWHDDVMEGQLFSRTTEKSQSLETVQKEKTKVYYGPISFFNWASRVDISTVSTFVPFLGFILITIGFIRILLQGIIIKKPASDEFPFFKSYAPITVSLGLIGTIWGIIMIGYYPEVEEIKMPQLINCLHTSLYSTLVAIVWTFLVAIPVRKGMQWWYRQATGEEVGPEEDIISVFIDLNQAISRTKKELSEMTQEVEGFKNKTNKVKKELKRIKDPLANTREEISKITTQFERAMKTISDSSDSWQKAGNEMNEAVNRVSSLVEKERKRSESLQSKLDKEERRRKDAEFKLEKARGVLQ